ncbi:MAG: MFS transporter [Eubacterium sp.]|nr:MFS transporter [Eubacterium sp.]MDY4110719.1 MFS transporter [Eubacterium sp.]
MTENKYKITINACFLAYIVQAIVNNFAPLLFVTFQREFDIPLSKITLLITFNFLIQLLIDLASAKFVDKIGYKASMVIAHFMCALGLVSLTFLPGLFSNSFVGLLVAVMIYAVGGGLLEVLVSPVVEACPTDNKEKAMSLLHSFYCWGQMGVILISTLFFAVFSIENWRALALIWALLPVVNAFIFMKAPIASLNEEGEKGMTIFELAKNKLFWVLFLMMVCAGASEAGISQWASAFAEKGLGVTKTVGDLAGPMAFACLMGISRVLYGKFGHKIKLDKFMNLSCLLCIASYLVIGLVPNSVVGLIGCALCGFSVGIMWPGTFSKAAASLKRGGTAIFALLALGGDLGGTSGPTIIGFVSDRFNDNMRMGILVGTFFPILLLLGIYLCKKEKARNV